MTLGTLKDPKIKITKIKDRWHGRLTIDGELWDEMACSLQEDIGFICRYMLRWYDKLGGNSKHASNARKRHNDDLPPVGRIYYSKDLKRERDGRTKT